MKSFGFRISSRNPGRWIACVADPQIQQLLLNMGLLGIHEGTVSARSAHQRGLETQAWVLDEAQAPAKRDWVGSSKALRAELYFASRSGAITAQAAMRKALPEVRLGRVREIRARNWNRKWQKGFRTVFVKPFWKVTPAGLTGKRKSKSHRERRIEIKIRPGAGFGTGTHPTTQLCLEQIGSLLGRPKAREDRILDFGAGSGILSIAGACLGARVAGLEIDPLALNNAKENARLNQVKISWAERLARRHRGYDLIVANILRDILIEKSEDLVSRLRRTKAVLMLSGLTQMDTGRIIKVYRKSFRAGGLDVWELSQKRKKDWCLLLWQVGVSKGRKRNERRQAL